jgi:hypothetical protein
MDELGWWCYLSCAFKVFVFITLLVTGDVFFLMFLYCIFVVCIIGFGFSMYLPMFRIRMWHFESSHRPRIYSYLVI